LPEKRMVFVAIDVVIADDSAAMRALLRIVIEAHPGVKVVGEAENGRKAVHQALALKPHVVVMDVQMQGLDGIEATREISASESRAVVIGVSMHTHQSVVGAMVEAGADGFVAKEDACEELGDAVTAVAAGGTYLSAAVRPGDA
jgi:DNA-binding NarL/FixJ family response regulator